MPFDISEGIFSEVLKISEEVITLKNAQLGVPVEYGEKYINFKISLPINAIIQNVSLNSENGYYFIIIHFQAHEDNSNETFKPFNFSLIRYSSERIEPENKKHLCDLEDGLHTYGVFYTS